MLVVDDASSPIDHRRDDLVEVELTSVALATQTAPRLGGDHAELPAHLPGERGVTPADVGDERRVAADEGRSWTRHHDGR